ncbi:MFS transporter [Pelagibacterium montanilacus]|uniref:MFS transporter n=1 Tax=Pelagibacterium montanilacus TaxID=2185280 RepID=UPI000F8E8537|nr:MFS transporter [Pelagibacterium montanilacus]
MAGDGKAIDWKVLAAYGAPALPMAALALPLYVIVPTFYSETLGLSLAAVGAALLWIRIADGFTDPLVGWLADRITLPAGRRRSLFALSLPVTALGAFMLFNPPPDAGIAYLVIWGLVVTTGYTLTGIPFTAWGAELETAYARRNRVVGVREGFTVLGTVLAIAIPLGVGALSGSEAQGLTVLGAAVAVALLSLGALAFRVVPEPRPVSRTRVTLGAGLAIMAGNKPFVRLILAYFVNGLANGIPATLFLYFVSDRLGAPELRGPLLLLYFLCGVAGIPLAIAAAARFGKHRAWCVAMAAACLVFAVVPFIAPGNVVAFAAVCVGTGVLLGFDLTLPGSMQADVIDVDTDRSGEQRSGLYFAAWSLATKLSLALGVGLVLPILDAVGFVPGAGAPDARPAVILAGLYAWLPIVLKLGAIALMWTFPLDAAGQEALRQRIDRWSEDGET